MNLLIGAILFVADIAFTIINLSSILSIELSYVMVSLSLACGSLYFLYLAVRNNGKQLSQE